MLREPVEVQDLQNCFMSLLILNEKIREWMLIVSQIEKHDNIQVNVQNYLLSKVKVRARCWKRHRA